MSAGHRHEGQVKCVVWDLDNTLWDGVLLEDPSVELRPEVGAVIRTLDERGVLHSIASRNDPELAMSALTRFGIGDYFLYPQIGWMAKSGSIARIADELKIGIASMAFIDDDAFERGEVAFAHPSVLCIDASQASEMPSWPRFLPTHSTEEARNRRSLYIADGQRRLAEEEMAPSDFLDSLEMVFTISDATSEDLGRVAELMARTNQLNSTGEVFSDQELEAARISPDHSLLVAELVDRFGSYGKIGVSVVEHGQSFDTVRILLMSCRVMARGVGKILLDHIVREASTAGTFVRARFRRTELNRPMYLTFKMAGFREVERSGNDALLEHDGSSIDPVPSRVRLVAPSR